MVIDRQANLFGEQQETPHGRRKRLLRIRAARYRGPLFPLVAGEMGKLEVAFWKFHNANPKVYRLLVKFARRWREARGEQAVMGIGQLFERVRWEIALATVEDENFKLNNNHRAFYARLIMDRNAELEGIFRLRKQRLASTIGPPIETLPPGEHIA